MAYHNASARFLLGCTPLDRRRGHLGANSEDADDERSDERDDELAAEQKAGDAAVNVIVEALANPDLQPPTKPPGKNQEFALPTTSQTSQE